MRDYDAGSIEAIWNKTAENPYSGGMEIDSRLVVRVVLGCSVEGHPYLSIVSHEIPPNMGRLDSVYVRIGKIDSSPLGMNWSVTLTLLDPTLQHAYAEICSSLIRRIAQCNDEKSALKQVRLMIDQWQRLLRMARGDEKLKKLRGVFGELTAMRQIAALSGMSLDTIAQHWTGPYGAPQDYIFDDIAWEIKTVHPGSRTVEISSAEQLCPDCTLYLVIIELAGQTEGMNLPELVNALQEDAHDSITMSTAIRDGLEALGIPLIDEFVINTRFSTRNMAVYSVEDDFPRIDAKLIPQGVRELKYRIARDSIQRYMVSGIESGLSER